MGADIALQSQNRKRKEMEQPMDRMDDSTTRPMTRRQFVRVAGAGTAMAVVSDGIAVGQQDKPKATPAPAPSNAGDLRFRQIHLDFHTSPLIHDVAV